MLRNMRVVGCQIPEISVLPSVIFGAGASMFGFPSASRGIPGVLISSHCAEATVEAPQMAAMIAIRKVSKTPV